MIRLTTEHREQARQELARRNLADFACLVDIPTVPVSDDPEDEDDPDAAKYDTTGIPKLADHHALLIEKLQGIEDGSIPNLMVFMPPGSAKSTYVDVVFIPWFMARKPRRHVILASYASNIAAKQGRRARQLIKQDKFEKILGVSLDPDKSAADEWMLTNGSEYMAGGILSGLTGNRAWLGVWDDLIRGREAAESETIREKTWEAYQDDFVSRLVPGAPQIGIMTRWHGDDVAGRILPETWDGESGVFEGRDGRIWHVLCLPAVADRKDDPLGRAVGEGLWPEWFPMSHWEPFKRNARSWSSLYQQKPSPAEGTYFQSRWFDRYQTAPAHLNVYMTSDHAPKGGVGSDFNVIQVWGVDHKQHLWLLDEFRDQGTIDVAMGIKHDDAGNIQLADEGALPMIRKWKPLCWFPEDDVTWKATEAFVVAAMRRTKAYCRLEPLTTAGGDKPNKARAFQAKATMGEVHIPEGFMGDQVLEEYKKFPAGKNDDRVDCAAHIGRALDTAHPAIVPLAVPVLDPPDLHRRRAGALGQSAFG